ncbi:hypothetical protein [Streptomyces sp. W4I9-2]|uniref:hypothetical protein n=1 Tax=Streptomyces sp. W4I9-2 TaxID=3042297 RepID=UPI00358F624C
MRLRELGGPGKHGGTPGDMYASPCTSSADQPPNSVQALEELRAKTAAQQQARPNDASRARALQRLAAERAGLTIIVPAASPERLDRAARCVSAARRISPKCVIFDTLVCQK